MARRTFLVRNRSQILLWTMKVATSQVEARGGSHLKIVVLDRKRNRVTKKQRQRQQRQQHQLALYVVVCVCAAMKPPQLVYFAYALSLALPRNASQVLFYF